MPGLRGKVAFITGAASGLGAALAAVLAGAGADIVAADIRPEPLQAGVAALQRYDVRATALALDVADPSAARPAIERTLDTMGRLDILVNNAGADVTLPIDELSEQDWLRVVGTNLNGPFMLAKHAAAHMRAAAAGGNGGGTGGDIVLPVHETSWP
ncbi:SDR family oxidoreductase [Massilia forsythiae]|uniref:SDR family oxidoreductase n=1 Tax=Massilia forsythiae TaxID=2728020 RepID=A0A7Z2VXZ2_9BURK|nr:SDR family NAD(P)-dependent oxidoreductase [Massilia forsythiae]QJE01203.1 SDR family oxidoreductase [Massilia forsythiae]